MNQRLLRVSPSSLLAFFECPRRYHFAYVADPRSPRARRTAHQTIGDAVHRALAGWWELHPNRRSFGEAGNLLNAAWSGVGFRDAAQSDRWRDRARGWVRSYATGMYALAEPLGVERTVSCRDGASLVLEGRLDRLDDRGGQLVVVDYKVGRNRPTEQDARGSLALAVYAVAAGRMLRRRCARVELIHVPTRTVAAYEHDHASIRRHLDRVHAIADDLQIALDTLEAGATADEVFPAQPGPLCAGCDFYKMCADGQAAGPQAAPWAAVERWENELRAVA